MTVTIYDLKDININFLCYIRNYFFKNANTNFDLSIYNNQTKWRYNYINADSLIGR